MRTAYFTFGQSHTHSVAGKTVDKDTVIKITADDPTARMWELFGNKWSMEYEDEPDMVYYPGGIMELIYGVEMI